MNADEETVKEAEFTAGQEVELDFAFSVAKLKDGNLAVQKIDGLPSASPDDIYNSCVQIQRNLDTQNIAGAIQQAMIQAAQAAQKETDKLVIP